MNITVDRKVIEQALEALNYVMRHGPAVQKAKDLLQDALEQPEQEPVAWMLKSGHGTQFKEKLTDELKALTWKGKPMWTPLYVSPPQRKPLTEEEIKTYRHMIDWTAEWSHINFARAIEAAHGIKD